jgi:hypothetical protein
MHYGLAIANAGACADPRILADLAQLAEAVGWDGIFVEDYITHHAARDIPTCDPWIALAAMAPRTERVRLGISVAPLSRRRPWKVAREAVAIDQLSSGRLIVGVGLGDGNDISFSGVGEVTDARQRAEMLDEALDIIVGLWGGQLFSYAGKHYQVHDLTFLPMPVQQPRIPIWVGGGWPLKGPTRRASCWDGSCLYKHTYGGPWQDWTPADLLAFKADIGPWRDTAAPFDIAVGGRARSADWDQERALIGSLAEAGATWWVEYVDVGELSAMREGVARGPLRVKG